MNAYVVYDGPDVIGVRTSLPAAMILADTGDDDAHPTTPWSEIGPGYYTAKGWQRARGDRTQTIELFATGQS